MVRQFVARIESVVESAMLPRSPAPWLTFAQRERKKKSATSVGMTEPQKQLRGAMRIRTAPRSLGWPGDGARPPNREGAHPDFYSGDDVQRKPNETVGL
jgi:hypothetical protein